MFYSIVTLTYKRPELLEESVYSVLQQTYTNWELIIINDCVSQTILFDHPQVRIFNLKDRFKTIADKRNFGLLNCFGDWILQLDDDDFLLPSYLEDFKSIIGPAEWISCQKPIIYSDDISKIYLSPVPQSNCFFVSKKIAQQFKFESKNINELNPFYETTEKNFNGFKRYRSLPPNQCGHVWRHGIDKRRKYSLTQLIEKKISQNLWNEELGGIDDESGNIILKPKWTLDYVSIIKNNIKQVDPKYVYNKVKGGQELWQIAQDAIKEYNSKGTIQEVDSGSMEKRTVIDSWTKVKPTWENAVKFLKAAKSRGFVSTALDVMGLDVNSGERVPEDIYQQRKLSCFGDPSKLISPCSRLQKTVNGMFCSSCGCGAKEVARLDTDIDGGYTKLHYPQLECPLKRPGFSNEEKTTYLTSWNKIPFSIIIPVLNDNEELNLTVESIRKTSPDNVEIIVIDDSSDVPATVKDSRVKLFRFNERRGAGQARHFGALAYLLEH